MVRKEKAYQDKAAFVKNHLMPLLLALDVEVVNAEYKNEATALELANFGDWSNDKIFTGEWVVLTFKGGHSRGVYVVANSHLAICRDVLKTF